MARIQTQLNGISTASTYQDGECYSLVNLRPQNGVLRPVSPRKTVMELTQSYDIVFVHQNNNYKNWIGVKQGENDSSVYVHIDSSPEQIIASMTKVNSVQQIGNLVALVTEEKLYYLFFQNGAYDLLGEMPEIPVIGVASDDTSDGRIITHSSDFKITRVPNNEVNSRNYKEVIIERLVNARVLLRNGGNTDGGGPFKAGFGLVLTDVHLLRYAYRLYDGSLIKHSPPVLIAPPFKIIEKEDFPFGSGSNNSLLSFSLTKGQYTDNSGDWDVNIYTKARGYTIYFYYSIDIPEKWRNIIKSVDLFLSPPAGVVNPEEMRNDSKFEFNTYYDCVNYINTGKVEEISNFYLIRSLAHGESSNAVNKDIFPDKTKDVTGWDSLVQKEEMQADSYSHHITGAELSYAYNGRLHIAGLKTTFFKGFFWNYFETRSEQYNGISNDSTHNMCLLEVEINTGNEIRKVYSGYSFPTGNMTPLLSYPDERASSITVYEQMGSGWVKWATFKLKPHKYLPIAFYLDADLNMLLFDSSVAVENPDTSQSATLFEPNKLKVSSLNNPLHFPNVSTHQISNGKILNLASNATSISEGQFGQFPLYVFTSEGVYSLKVGEGEAVYSSLSSPTNYETPIQPFVCSTPFGVVFVSARGVCIISGQEVAWLTPQLKENPKESGIRASDALPGVIHDYENAASGGGIFKSSPLGGILLHRMRSFTDFLKNMDGIVYNPHENELVIFSSDSEYNYVYCFDSKQFYLSTEKFKSAVQNTFPELLVIEGYRIKDYSLSQSPGVHVSFVTRPLLFGTPDLKKLERMILRANLFDIQNPAEGKKSALAIYYSLDEVNFYMLRGISLNPTSRKDIDLGLFARSKFRQFRLAFGGIVDEESEIRLVETEIEKEYQNTKMR